MNRTALYRRLGYRFIQGWLEPEVLDIVARLDGAQRELDVRGAMAEIGVHHGRFLIGLHLLRRPATERTLAVDVFEDQHLNVDGSGRGDRERFLANVKRWSNLAGLVVHQGDSTALRPDTVRQLVGPIRLFSVDGGHTERIVGSDMRLAESTVCDGGIVIGDDVFNERWPEVSVATQEYLRNDGGLVPFGIGFNKVFFAKPEYAAKYRSALGQTRLFTVDSCFAGHDVTILLRKT